MFHRNGKVGFPIIDGVLMFGYCVRVFRIRAYFKIRGGKHMVSGMNPKSAYRRQTRRS